MIAPSTKPAAAPAPLLCGDEAMAPIAAPGDGASEGVTSRRRIVVGGRRRRVAVGAHGGHARVGAGLLHRPPIAFVTIAVLLGLALLALGIEIERLRRGSGDGYGRRWRRRVDRWRRGAAGQHGQAGGGGDQAANSRQGGQRRKQWIRESCAGHGVSSGTCRACPTLTLIDAPGCTAGPTRQDDLHDRNSSPRASGREPPSLRQARSLRHTAAP